ncbi:MULTISPECIES: restriction endonuclease subunit S [unclassified Pseudomonas]|uniref:restriction endonuclease subunit S n=1 Tax=unclassified Pseudomonas TaxID=196821 RepID=UPI001AE807E2|nr:MULTISPECIES: restriction endonuclease subunit S [unclassified Pseudomonas]MBP2269471.1 type I restriction enzyme S subunit [Pseudomonas sp. BP6]MBP2286247.1 type I restriction enzyme S subunit [Pseudomonas sp. BP7]HDS1696657.1 restriction endonuclease subunit S [Pseudomonas putida]HDS1701756.1 restriction endonuclease subunit S [Pseudomonas putida]
MSHYKPYPAYKDSGLEWLGRVPEHWQVMAIKHIVSAPITDGPHETPEFLDEGVPFVSAEAVSAGNINFEKIRGFISREDHERYSKKYFPQRGDIFMIKSGATTGVTAIVDTDNEFNIWSPLAVIRCGERSAPYFVLNFMRSRNFQEAVALSWSYGTQQNIGMGVIGNLAVTVPPQEEQQVIAAHLDRETARIDALIEKKTRFIELLREKRQALIINAVTKGLDPNVGMKDSGVKWLGEVPEHWNVLQLRHTARLESGHTPSRSKPEYWVDCTVPWFTLADVWQVRSGEQKYVSETSEKVSQLGLENSSARLLPAGSVFLSRTASVGFPGIMAVDMATSQDFAVWTCTSELFNEYLYYVLLGMKPDFDRLMMGSTHKTIYMPDIEAIRIACPPVDEQRGIVSALSAQLGRFRIIIDKTERSIELLKERRSALITAAVTGQIDLREAV